LPWQATELWLAPVAAGGNLGPPVLVAGGAQESIFQPSFSPGGELHFVSDRSGWWNLYRYRRGQVEPVWSQEAELGVPQWVFGLATHGWVGPTTVACAFQRDGTWRLGLLDTDAGRMTLLAAALTEIGQVKAVPGRAVFVGASAAEPPALWQLEADALS